MLFIESMCTEKDLLTIRTKYTVDVSDLHEEAFIDFDVLGIRCKSMH